MTATTHYWDTLEQHRQRLSQTTPAQWLAQREQESEHLWQIRHQGVLVDISRQRLDTHAMGALLSLAQAAGVAQGRDAMFAGELINSTEGRSVEHWQWRSPAPSNPVAAEQARLAAFACSIEQGAYQLPSGQMVRDVLHIGIGGSFLGPLLVSEALSFRSQTPVNTHYAANVDAHELLAILDRLDPRTTLVTIASKTFTTRETMRNAQTVLEWMVKHDLPNPMGHCVALTAKVDKAIAWGIPDSQIFTFDDSVGGRFSLWSPIGLPARLSMGELAWQQLLDGAHDADQHFKTAEFKANIPVVLALLDVWNHSICNIPARVCAPYDARLAHWVRHLQQLEMESLGKGLTPDGQPATRAACPMIWGEPGTNGQHAYFQWMHQANIPVAVEVFVIAQAAHYEPEHQRILLANGLAQADAFAYGRNFPRTGALTEEQAIQRDLPGGKPVTVWGLPHLDAYSLGFLIACYEHKMLCLSKLWSINAFDQFGVEMGKTMATEMEHYLAATPGAQPPVHMRSVLSWISQQNT